MKQQTQIALESAAESFTKAFGARVQMIKACEEMGELITQLSKRLNDSPATKEAIIDEIADVLITVHQMRFIFGEKETDDRIIYKLGRTMDYIRSRGQGSEQP